MTSLNLITRAKWQAEYTEIVVFDYFITVGNTTRSVSVSFNKKDFQDEDIDPRLLAGGVYIGRPHSE